MRCGRIAGDRFCARMVYLHRAHRLSSDSVCVYGLIQGKLSVTMADGGSDDDVIHLVSFDVHGSRSRKWELITISDDSDEETLIPGSPVLVPDDADDDDISVLEQLTPARRRVIRPAAKWSGASHNLIQVVGHSSSTSEFPQGTPVLTPLPPEMPRPTPPQ